MFQVGCFSLPLLRLRLLLLPACSSAAAAAATTDCPAIRHLRWSGAQRLSYLQLQIQWKSRIHTQSHCTACAASRSSSTHGALKSIQIEVGLQDASTWKVSQTADADPSCEAL
ncbi:hypothetical protein CCHR01_04516 [Colletotrichum chrysophilum]|uniref:Secreted protein n=1 Tax=Colletotrichum chrysophilum TaxID=1836956 RepID=A0AAD9AQY9_9PEZI|nr:hypothetical protein CCHR01_04516 [Colletotrichum chrysophilum]